MDVPGLVIMGAAGDCVVFLVMVRGEAFEPP